MKVSDKLDYVEVIIIAVPTRKEQMKGTEKLAQKTMLSVEMLRRVDGFSEITRSALAENIKNVAESTVYKWDMGETDQQTFERLRRVAESKAVTDDNAQREQEQGL